jgi:hypothetical protein
VRNRFSEEYTSAYQKLVRVSEPEEDYDGLVDLYKLFVARTSTALMYTSNLETDRRIDASTHTCRLSSSTT